MSMPILIVCGMGLGVAILLGLWRVVRGPSLPDRILAFDLVVTGAVGLLVLLSAFWETRIYLEAILVVSLLGFFTTVAFTQYLSHSRQSTDADDSAGSD